MAKKQQEPIHKLTLDEYDELTAHHQKLGASYERRDIIANLNDLRDQVMRIKFLTSNIELIDDLMSLYDGITGSINAINKMPDLYDRAGCSECGAI